MKVFIAPAVVELEFIPEFVPAEALPGADALALAPPVPTLAPAAPVFEPVAVFTSALLPVPSWPVT